MRRRFRMSQRATIRSLLVLGATVLVLAGIVVWLTVVEVDDRQKLEGVQVVGPCRAAYAAAKDNGATNPEAVQAATRNAECQQQSFLLFETCVRKDLHPA